MFRCGVAGWTWEPWIGPFYPPDFKGSAIDALSSTTLP